MTKFLFAVSFVFLGVPWLSAAEINVSPTGPIATLEAARDAVRDLRAGGERGDIDVVIEAGTYRLDQTLILGLEDSAPEGAVTRYRAAEGARPIISGGRVIDNWKPSEFADGKIWVAEVPWAKDDTYFHTLFDGSEQLPRAKSSGIQLSTSKGSKSFTRVPLSNASSLPSEKGRSSNGTIWKISNCLEDPAKTGWSTICPSNRWI